MVRTLLVNGCLNVALPYEAARAVLGKSRYTPKERCLDESNLRCGISLALLTLFSDPIKPELPSDALLPPLLLENTSQFSEASLVPRLRDLTKGLPSDALLSPLVLYPEVSCSDISMFLSHLPTTSAAWYWFIRSSASIKSLAVTSV